MSSKIDFQQLLREGALSILEGIGDAISIQDLDMRIIYQNQVHVKMMGNHVGEECFRAFHGKDAVCNYCGLLPAMTEGKTRRWESSVQSADGTKRYVEIVATPLRDSSGKIIAGIESVRNISEHKLLLEKLNAITSDLEQKSWKLMSANSELEKFSYTLSHDMRNYLARILMALHGLTTECAADLSETGQYFVTSIEESCKELEELVDAILRLCSSSDSEVPRVEVDLSAIASEIAQELNFHYSQNKVDFTVDPGLVANGDSLLIKAVLKNLLGNAWKYSRNTPNPKVSFYSEEHDGEVVYVVSDNGIGFDMIEADRLFKPFCRLSNSDGVKGMGIGLATVRRIIRSHGGEIWGKGEKGKGATFYFTLQQSA